MTQGERGRHRGAESRRNPKRTIAVVVAVFAVVVSVAATAWAISGGPGAETQAADSSPPANAATANDDGEGQDDSVSAAEESLVACAQALELADEAVAAAEPGVDNWEAHIRAHTDLVNGEVSWPEAEQIFDETAADGPGDLKRFDAAEKAYQEAADACDGLQEVEFGDRLAPAAEACQYYSAAARSAVEAASATIEDWREHLADERKHAEGELTGDEAEEKWIQAWRNGGPRITSFRSAVDQRDSTPACPTPTPTPE